MWPHIDIYACTTLHVYKLLQHTVSHMIHIRRLIMTCMHTSFIYLFVHYIITSIQTNKNDYSTLLQSTVDSLQSTVSLKKKY